MKKLQQTRLHNPPEIKGNCFPAVIACLLDLDSAEDVIQIQDKFSDDWVTILDDWLIERGWEWGSISGHLFEDEFYLVIGKTERFPSINHVCIYQNGKLYHDPHPSGKGLITEEIFEIILKKS